MQNNITEITHKLLGALDGNYNVTNMATIIEVISLLEKVSITKELLETTRLGKHINELRKHISNEPLAKRAKMLVKKWRNIVLVANPAENAGATGAIAPATTNGQIRPMQPIEESRKRTLPRLDAPHVKKQRANGGAAAPPFDYDFSDNSNSSFKDVPIVPKPVVVVNSDSNSSIPEVKSEPNYEEQQPKKRGRKKGSKNHKNLIEEAESSFSNKMAVSRGNAKVKTTQELIESLQNRTQAPPAAPITSPAKNIEDWRERAAKLTERVSLIDKKLNSGGRLKKQLRNNNKEVTPPLKGFTPEPVSRPASPDDEDEIVVVDDMPCAKWTDESGQPAQDDPAPVDGADTGNAPRSLSVADALSRLPPIDRSMLHTNEEEEGPCLCVLEDHEEEGPKFRVHDDCTAHKRLSNKYRLNDISDDKVALLHTTNVENLNGNFAKGSQVGCEAEGESRLMCATTECGSDDVQVDGSRDLKDVKIVPNFYQLPAKRASCSENYKKYSISEPPSNEKPPGGGNVASAIGEHGLIDNDSSNDSSRSKFKHGGTSGDMVQSETESEIFREFHECLDRPSYNGELLRILPYVVID